MSEHHIEVVRLGPVEKHENADTLAVTLVHGGYPCIVRIGEFSEGDLAVYVPVDAVVPVDHPRFAFLGAGHGRIRSRRLRGVFSMGLLVKPESDMSEGDDVAERWGITKWEPPEYGPGSGGSFASSGGEPCPFAWPVYDLEGLRKYGGILEPGEPVQVSEKIHGCNGRFVYKDGRLWVGSRNQAKLESEDDLWWRVARQHDLAEKLANVPDVVVYGEVYGQVQDLKYGVDSGARFAIFDAVDLRTMRWFDVSEIDTLAAVLDVPRVPELYRGPWDPSRATEWAEGPSTLAAHVREGFVVRPLVTRHHPRHGRVILKMHGQGYLLRKGG